MHFLIYNSLSLYQFKHILANKFCSPTMIIKRSYGPSFVAFQIKDFLFFSLFFKSLRGIDKIVLLLLLRLLFSSLLPVSEIHATSSPSFYPHSPYKSFAFCLG